MARQESAREDLLREATALVERAELQTDRFSEPVVFGFRRDGAASIFFGADPVLQFNARGELRRAYWNGQLVKAEQGRLVALRRQRLNTEVQLLRYELTNEETLALLQRVQEHLTGMRQALASNRYSIIGQVPAQTDVLGRIRQWLETCNPSPIIASIPNVS